MATLRSSPKDAADAVVDIVAGRPTAPDDGRATTTSTEGDTDGRSEVRADLLAEQAALDEVVAGLTDEQWRGAHPQPALDGGRPDRPT